MENLMPDVAKLLGVEIGEVFKVDNCLDYKFKFLDGGYLMCIEKPNGEWADRALLALLHGNAKIVKLPFKPKDGERFYFWSLDNNGKAYVCAMWFSKDDMFLIQSYMLGNCYRTKAECLADTAMKERVENMERCKW